MSRKIAWLLVTWFIVAALFLACCSQAVIEEEESPPPILPLTIGETAQTPKMRITISEAVITDSYEYYSQVWEETRSKEAPPGWVFLLATVEIENVGSEEEQVGLIKMRATDSDDFNYAPIVLLTEDRLVHAQELASGNKLRGRVFFKIPEGATGLKIIYNLVSLNVDIEEAEWKIE